MSEQERSMSNPEVADLLDLHFTFVSRLRSGIRQPSYTTLAKVKAVFDWPFDEQVGAILNDRYHIELEKKIDRYAAAHPKEKANA